MAELGLRSLPVLMHHYISNFPNKIAVSPQVFEEQCRVLAEHGWFGVSLAAAEEFLLHGAPLPRKSFLMTFDDGYLDNFVYALPILRKYGHKGTIFAVADRISGGLVRFGLSEAAARPRLSFSVPPVEAERAGGAAIPSIAAADDLLREREQGYAVKEDNFFTWEEARQMEQSGVISIAAHSLRHERVLTGEPYAGFLRPQKTLRTFWHVWPRMFWGLPDFPQGHELTNRAFVLSPQFTSALLELVPQDEARAWEFFQNPENVQKLRKLAESFKGRLGELESPQDQVRRISGLFKANRQILARELGHPVRSFCWPWGAYSQQALELGREAGFEVFYTCEMGVNPPGRPLAVRRFKVKNRPGAWLLNRLRIYSSPLLGRLYKRVRI